MLQRDGHATRFEREHRYMTSGEAVRAVRPAGKRPVPGGRLARSARRTQARRAAHYRLVAEAMPHMVWTAHADGSIAYGNAALHAYTGIPVAEQFTTHWRSVVHSDDIETFAARWFAASGNATPFECESRLRRAADGMYRWHVTRAVPVFAASGELTSWIASSADIHDFKLASETRTILDTIGHIVTIVDANGSCEYTSAGWTECFGTNDRAATVQLRDRVHPDDAGMLARALAQHDPVRQCELRLRNAGDAYRWFLCRTTVLDGPAHSVVCTLTDIDDFKRAQAAVSESETRYRALTDALPQMIWILDGYLHIEYINERWKRFIGDGFTVGMQLDLSAIIHPDDLPRAQASYLRRLEAPSFESELRMRRHDGTYHWHLIRRVVLTDRLEGGSSWIITATDITARKSAEAELEHRASHDALTDLPTRAVLMDRLSHALDAARRTNSELLVVYLDIDHFKTVNDTLGHRAGDRLLLEVAGRIRSVLRAGDTASRFGGDEFVLICAVENAVRDAAAIADRLAGVIRAPLMLDGKHIAVASSIGISRFPLDGCDAADLIQKADAAMYAAKKSGRNTYRAYETTQICIPAALELEVELRAALERREFAVYYQPIMDLAQGIPAGAEALVRWNHPTRGILPPSEFIPFAEEHGLIVPIGEQVLATACAQIRALDLDPRDRFCVSVNVSAHQFARPDFAGSIAAAVAHYRIAPQHLELEITESVVMYGTSAAIGTFCELEANGVRLSIDDFGTGYCSLSYVKNFPLHTLKIDRAFVTDIAQNSTDQAIAKTIVTLAHSLRMRTIAEGVETPAQLEALRAFGADCVQGYLLGRPMPAADFVRFLRTFPAARRAVASAAR